jgi:hypothetical protein
MVFPLAAGSRLVPVAAGKKLSSQKEFDGKLASIISL